MSVITQRYSNGANAGANGTAEADLQPPSGKVWLVQNIAVSGNATGVPTCSIYVNGQFICGTNLGNGDSADGSPIPIRQTDTLQAVWSGANVGASFKVAIVVQEALIGEGLL